MKNYIESVFIFFTLFVFVSKAYSGEGEHPDSPSNIRFTENKNQWNKNVLYRAQLDGGALFLKKNCFTYRFYDKAATSESQSQKQGVKPIRSHAFKMTFLNAQKDPEITATQPTVDFCNYFIGKDKSKWASNVKNYKEVNYKNIYDGISLQILGSENSIKYTFYVAPQKDVNNIQLFYEGLSALALDNGTLKLTTTLNELVEQHPFAYQWVGEKRMKVPCEFVIENSTVHFQFPKGYDKNYELVIDPVLVFAATSGSTATNFGHCATYDVNGNLYSGGIAFSQGYPYTLGAYDTVYNAPSQDDGTDVVITKYDSSGTFLQYSTYLGGSTSSQIVTSLIVDAQNNLVLYGVTGCSDFPVTPNAYDTTFNGGSSYTPSPYNGNYFFNGTDIFVAKFNATGTSLLASTYIGGSGNDGVNTNNIANVLVGYLYDPATRRYDIPINSTNLDSLQYNYGDYYRGEVDLDAAGNIVVATASRSNNFPIVNGFDNTLGGQQDAVVFKFNTNLSQLIWSTYLGGSDNDCANSIALDNSSNVYVTGGTRSSNFNTTAGALQTSYNGGAADGYITQIKQDGSSVLSSTLWGTSGYDQSYFVQLDKKNNVYVFGQTDGVMPVTAGVYNNPNSGQFITKMNDSLNRMIFSTVFGNKDSVPNISPTAFLVDNCENIYVSGWPCAYNTNLPPATGMAITPNALDTTTTGYKFYLMALTANASSLMYSTYFGGNQSHLHCHGGTSRYDKKGIVYQSLCTGCGGLQDYPVSPGAYPLSAGGSVNGAGPIQGCNNGVFKFDFQVPLIIADFNVNVQNGCAPQTVHFTNKSTLATTFLWDFGGGDTTSTVLNPVRTYSVTGTYLVKLFVFNPAICNGSDSVFRYITVNPSPALTGSYNQTICSGQGVNTNPFTSTIPSSFTWVASPNPNITGEDTTLQYTSSITDTLINTTSVDQTVIYTITPTSTANSCVGPSQTFTVTVIPNPVISITNSSTICNKQTLNIPLSSNVFSSYSWVAANNSNTSGESTTPQSSNTINNTITNNTAVIQPVIYTITPTSIAGNCIGAVKTFTVFVNPTPALSITNDTTICNKQRLSIPLTSNIPSSFTWIASLNPNTTGESITLQSSDTINDIITNNSAVVQSVTYTITPTSITGNCLGTVKTFTVFVNPAPVISINADTTICSKQALNIPLSSTIPSSYSWIAADNLNTTGESTTPQSSNTINNTITNSTAVVQPVIYTITPTSITGNCVGTIKTFTVLVNPTPVLSISTDTTICDKGSLNIPLSSTVLSSYSWVALDNSNTTGESTTPQSSDTLNNTITNNTTVIQPVIYNVTPTSITGSCVGAIKTFTVFVNPTPVLSINHDTTVCNKGSFNLLLSSNIPSSFTWIASPNPNTTGENTTLQHTNTINDTIINNSSVNQTIIYTITPTSIAGNCVGPSETYTVIVRPPIIAKFGFTHNACLQEATFTDSSKSSPVKWLWNFGDGTTDTLKNPPTHIFYPPEKYDVSLTVYNSSGCMSTYSVTIDFSEPAVSVSPTTGICIPEQAQLQATGGVTYKWSPTTNLSNPAIANPVATPVTTTTYSVIITTATPLGDSCQQTLSTTVNVTNPALYSLSATVDKDTLIQGQSTTMHAITTHSLTVTWSPTQGINNAHSFNPTVTTDSSTTYTVSILDAQNCPKTATVSIYVISSSCASAYIFVPNTFTPNGDGVNDVLYVKGYNITDLYFAVYNRWGQPVFETTSLNNGWNGVYNGFESGPVVFAWYLRAKCYNGDAIEKKGNVSLIR